MLIARSVHPLPGEAERKERLLALVDGFSSRRVLVVGDLIADEFIYGEVARVSREAPVLILKYDATRDGRRRRRQRRQQRRRARRPRARSPASSAPIAEGRRLLASFHRGVDRSHDRARARVPHAGEDAHPRRRRPFGEAAGRAHRSRDRLAARPRRSSRAFAEKLEPALDECDAVLLSDYGSGLVTPALAAAIRRALGAPLAPAAGAGAGRLAAIGCSTTAA